MQDQPRYEVYEGSKFFADGQASRPYVEGTVPRGYLREDTAFYQGRRGAAGAQAGANVGGAQPVSRTSSPNAAGGGGGQAAGGDVNVRGNAGGPVGAAAAGGAQPGAAAARDGLVNEFPFPITEQDLNRGQERYAIYCSLCHGATGFGDGMIVRRGFRQPPSFHDERLRAEPLGHFFDVITNGWGAMAAYSDMIPPDDRWRIIAYLRALQLSRGANAAGAGATGAQPQPSAPGGVSPEAGGPRPGGTPPQQPPQGSGGGHR